MKPREKLTNLGIEALSERDLISLLIGVGIKGRDFTKVAGSVIKYLRANLDKGIQLSHLSEIEGMGEAKAGRVYAGLELGRRLYGERRGEKILPNTAAAAEYFLKLGFKKTEQVKVAFLNARYELIESLVVASGGLNVVSLMPRDILFQALRLGSACFVVAHNHPSGNPDPSIEDINFTQRLKKASDIVGVKMLDHIIVAKGDWKAIEIDSAFYA